MESWAKLTQAVTKWIERSEPKARAGPNSFNLFTTLLKAHDEVRLHSTFLHCLLDPSGTHGQGPRFLELFIETLAEWPAHDHEGRPSELPSVAPSAGWSVERETRRGGYGQLDLLLTAPAGGLAWVIENKVFHHEGDKQIESYINCLQKYYPAEGSRVFFLTLNGRHATSAAGKSYYRLSYSRHILRWMEKCSDAVSSGTPIHHAIIQYQDVVRQLVGRALDHPAMQEIKNQIIATPSIIRYRAHVTQAIKEIQCDVADQIANAVRDKLTDKFTASVWGGRPLFEARNEGCYLFTPRFDRALASAPLHIALQFWTDRSYFIVGAYADEVTRVGHHTLYQTMLPLIQARVALEGVAYDILKSQVHWPMGWLILDTLTDDVMANWLEKKDTEPLIIKQAEWVRTWAKWVEEAYLVAKGPAAP